MKNSRSSLTGPMTFTLSRYVSLATLTISIVALVGCQRGLINMRGYRYGEILLVYPDRTEVWGTQTLNRCPDDKWKALDKEKIRTEYGAEDIFLNGPRHFVINNGSGAKLPKLETRVYGDLKMRRLATLKAKKPDPYTPVTVLRTNTWKFWKGSEVYELTDPKGQVYIMQSYSKIIDSDQTESDLSTLGERLKLPKGWTFSTRILEENLDVVADGKAIVVMDDLTNTYQKRPQKGTP